MQSRSFGFVRPDDTHYGQDVFIPKKCCGTARNNDKVVVRLLSYGSEGKKPEGEITEIIGNADDPSADITAIVRAFGIPDTFRERSCGKRGPCRTKSSFQRARTAQITATC